MELFAAPVSFAQQGLWYQAEMEPGNPAYHVPVAVRLRGAVDEEALARALRAIVDRHEILRTTFAWKSSELVQLIHPKIELPFSVQNISDGEEELASRIHEEIHRPFDLVRGPLLRFILFRMSADEAVLVGTMHHLVTDGWSIGVLTRELAAAYGGETLPDLEIQYADFAEWQREQAGHAWSEQVAYWRERLRGPLPHAELPLDYPRTSKRSYRGATERLRIPLATLDHLRRLSTERGATLFMTLLAAFKVLVYRHTHEPDVVVGSPLANRNRPEIEDLLGFFVNMQVLRTDFSGGPTFLEALERVKETTLGAWDHADVPFEVLAGAIQPDRRSADPFFKVVFALQNAWRGTLELPRVSIETMDVVTDTAKLALTVITEEVSDGLDLRMEYSSALFTRETVHLLCRRFQRLLEEICADPRRSIDVLPILAPGEAELLEEWGGGHAQFPERDGLPRWFEQEAQRFADRTAVRFEGSGLTYRELDERANRLARHLQERGVGPETLVGLCVDRSLDLVIGILGILKAGGAYVPLDPSYPSERLRFVIEDSRVAAIVTQRAHETLVRDSGVPLVVVDGMDREAIDAHSCAALSMQITPDQAAYVIYTSGSTGRPKGVVVTHGNVMRLMSSTESLYGFSEADVWTLFHSYAFDFSVWELWGALLYGGSVVVVPHATSRTPEMFLPLLRDEGVTVLNQTPSAFYQLMSVDDGGPMALRYVIFGGEALDIPRLETWFKRRGDAAPRLVNMYGITETTVHVTYRPIRAADAERASSVIGRALPDLHAVVLDARGELVPIGVPGELYVGGAGVARGYLRRDDLTAERFIECNGARMYRTGDLVRWLVGGELEYLGRIDTQVKVRGFRIELGEIEHVLRSGGEVRDVAVLSRPGASDQQRDQQRLVAYVVAEPGSSPTPADLRRLCEQQIPDYMVPAAYVLLDALPLTANGKLDRDALPDPDLDRDAVHEEFIAPRNETEATLARIWSEVLKVERVGVEDNFFSLGGDSILLLQIAAKSARAGVKFSRRDLIEHQTIAELASLVRPSEPAATPVKAIIVESPLASRQIDDEVYALTPLQEGLLFHSVFAPSDGVYVEQLHGDVAGALDVDAFERAWQGVIARHPVLRTSFAWQDPSNGGQPRQRVAPTVSFALEREDWRDTDGAEQQRRIETRIREDRRRGFDLSHAPLTRVAMFRLADDRWHWLWTHHHLVLDGWCLSHLMTDVLECYEAYRDGREPQLPERRPFRDYIEWLAQQDAAAAETYWRETLAGFTTPSRVDAPKPSEKSGAYERDLVLTEDETSRLQAWSRQAQITPSTLVTAAWAMLIRAYSGSDDVVFGVTVSGRPAELTGFETMIGPFINTLPLRVRMDRSAPFEPWLRDLQHRHARMREYEYSRLVDIQRWSDLPAGEALFDTLMVFENYPVDASLQEQQSGLEFGPVTFVERSNYPLALAAIPGPKLTLRLYFDDARFDFTTVGRILAELRELLVSAISGDVASVGAWNLVPAAEQQLLGAWSATDAPYSADRCVHELFDAQAAATPDAVAAVFGELRLTYRELRARADRLAGWLRRHGAGPEVLVAVQLERSVEMLVAVLAVWKSGAAYVPLDPSYPPKRLQHMLEDSGARILVTHQTFDELTESDGESIAPCSARLDNLAYVIYTSGSTGQPKGTLVTHRGLANLAQAQSRAFDVRPGDRVLQFASLSFDASASEIVMALCFGAELHLVERDEILPGQPFVAMLRQKGITHLTIPPSVLAALPFEPLPDLRSLIVAGEACPKALAELWSAGRRFLNAYGPTENTVCASIAQYDGGMLTIGRPMANVRIHILDHQGMPAPVGVAGELHIGGVGVSRGYLRRPALTAERFVADPFGMPGGRLYKSGDLARWLAHGTIEHGTIEHGTIEHGTIEYLGRIDHQVKIRGHRIELDEIAQVMREKCGLRDAAVLALPAPSGQHRLVAYAATGGRAVTPAAIPAAIHAATDAAIADELRAACVEWLPEHMVPAAFVVLDELPLTPSGKLDRRALPDPDQLIREAFTPATNEIEAALSRVWSQVLGVERVGIEDNFFALGGDSIISLQVVSRAAQEGVQITPRDIFQHPTVAALARVARHTGAATAAPYEVRGPIPFTPIQRWFFEQRLEHPDHWNQAVLVEVAPSLDPEILEEAVRAVGRHHSALRTRFSRVDGVWQQRIDNHDEGIAFERILDDDVAGHAERAQSSLSLADGPLARALYFVNARQLLVVIHHLVVDGVSWRVLLEDVQRSCEGHALEPATPFGAWAQRLEAYARSEAVDVAYWRELSGDGFRPVDHSENRSGSVRPVEMRLTEEETEALLRRVPAIHQTQVNDVLLAAFAASMRESNGSDAVWVNLEGHGREPLFDDVDLSRTVGWFTSLFPVRLEVPSVEPGTLLRSIRDQLRRVPMNGIGFGIARYLGGDGGDDGGDGALASLPEPDVSFNYLGQLDQSSSDEALFRLIDGPVGEGQHPDERRRHLLDVVASVRSGRFRIAWHYSTAIHERSQIEALAGAYMAWLRRMLESVEKLIAGADAGVHAGVDVEEIYGLTPMQQGLLFHALHATESDLYLEQLHGELRGAVDAGAFERAWQEVIARHAIFRTSFVWEGVDGSAQPLQRVERRVAFRLDLDDWRALSPDEQSSRLANWLDEDRRRGFALDRAPLLRVALIRLADDRWHWIWTHHHILLDGWCLALVVREVLRCYEAFAVGSIPPATTVRPYRDYIQWLASQDGAAAERYWRKVLAGFTAPTRISFPADVSTDGGPDDEGQIEFALTAEETQRLQEWARRHHLTLGTLVTGAWARVLQTFCGSDDVVFGVTVSGRPPSLPGSDQMIGLFINTLPLRVGSGRGMTLTAWLEDVQQQQVDLRDFEYSRLVDVQRWSDLSAGDALFETLLAFDNYPVDRSLEQRFGEIGVEDVKLVERTHYPMTLSIVPGEAMRMRSLYDPRRFSGTGVRRMLDALRTLLNAAAADRVPFVESWSLVDDAQRQLLLARSSASVATQIECLDSSLHGWFSRVAAVRGDAPAVRWQGQELSYRELERRANRLAHHLRARGVGPETLVGLRIERSLDLVVGILGILKSGGAYVPIDPSNPPERTSYILRDSGARFVVTEETLRSEELARTSDEPPISGATPANAAYVIYTSGSTGRPKGCIVTHANVSRLMRQTEGWFDFGESDVWTLFHSSAFDFSVWEIWGALLYGGRLVVVPYAVSRSPEEFHDLLAREGVTVLNQTPSAFRQLIAVDEQRDATLALRYVIFGGEALQIDALGPWFARRGDETPRLVNMYGITETTVHVTYRPITKADLKSATGSRIGVAIPDLQLYVLDHHRQLVPDGVAGELYVAGGGVARGYLGQPRLTAQRMIANPFGDGRVYRTGDLVRWRDDGLEYLGRIDEQVKVRGFRIELGEIESVLAEHPAVREVVVLLKDQRLVAYVVRRGDSVSGEDDFVTTAALRTFAAARLPDYMLPSAFVFLDAMPLTANGKIHRAALPAPTTVAVSESYAAPRTERERILAEVWGEVLEVAAVGIHDSFFALGGDSIRSIQVISRARARGVELTFQELFEHPTIAELSGAGPAAPEERTAPFSLVSQTTRDRLPEEVEDAYPLTMLQQGMFFHSDAYHDVMSYHLRAPYDRHALEEALAALSDRHAILRTSFDFSTYDEPLQLVHRHAAIPCEETSAGSLSDWIERERRKAFDPAVAPLLRVHLRTNGDGTFHFTVSFHHAILDGWSLASMLTELFRGYLTRLGKATSTASIPESTFRDFVALERRVLDDPAERAFWTSFLEEAEPAPLPRFNVEKPRFVERREIAISGETSRGLKRLADEIGVPIRSVLLAAHVRALAHITNREDVVTGLVTNGRPERADGDRVLGLFLNTVPFRMRLGGGKSQASWSDLVRETFRIERQIAPHRRFPLSEIQKACGGSALFETDFNFVHFHVFDQLSGIEGVETLGGEGFEETNFAIAVNFSWGGSPAQLAGTIDCDASLLTADQIASYAACYAAILEAMAARPGDPWAKHSLLAPDVRQRLLHDLQGAVHDDARPQALHELVAPPHEATAVAFADESLTYDELHRRANRLAHALQRAGVGPDVLVGVALESSAQRVVALMAVLKAGGAYLPIDPGYPEQLLALMIEGSGIAHLITKRDALPDDLAAKHVFDVDDDYGSESDAPPVVTVSPDNLAYALYTSGSTGKPKGVLITHRAIVNHMRWMQEAYPLAPDDRVFQKTPFSFDASVWEFWAPLVAGATLWGGWPGGQQDPSYLIETIRGRALTVIQVVPTLLELLLDDPGFAECRSLERVFVGGEPLTPALVRRFQAALPRTALINLYGPTEAAIDSTSHLVGEAERFVPIGRPIRNARAYVLDARMEPVPIGTDGDLYIGGDGVGRGYHGRPALTAASFVADPYAETGSRLYRTGDLARWLPDGVLEFRGRADDQVKVRGHRVELGEIEAVLVSHPSVRRAVVAVRDHRLVAYIVGEPATDLRSFLAERLPEHMLPSAFVFLDALPLTPSGKIDRRALPAPDAEETAVRRAYVAPTTDAQRALVAAWQSVLGLDQVGVEDNFFELGGDSILSLQIVSRVRRDGWKIAPGLILQQQTIARIALSAERIGVNAERVGEVAGDVTDDARPSGDVPLLPIQHAFFEQPLADPHHWNQSTLLTVPKDFSFDRFRDALQTVVAHHDAFRLRFAPTTGGWRQYYADVAGEIPCEQIASSDIEAEANRIQAALDITHGPVMRAAHFDCGRLLLVIHHLVVDAVSWRILLDDLAAAYEGKAVPPRTTSLRAWSERLQAYEASGAYWYALADREMPRLPADLPGGGNLESEARDVRVEIDARELLETRTSDALLSALAEALTHWIGSDEAWVDVEGHGREDLFHGVDLSRTIGWFTSLFPVALASGRLNLPDRGIDFGVLRYVADDPTLAALPPREVSFNYLGRVDQGFQSDAFGAAPESAGFDRGPANERRYLLDVTARISAGRLIVDWTYPGNRFHEETIARVAGDFVDALERNLAAGIEDVLSLSPLQEGLLFHALDEEQRGVYVQQITARLEGIPNPAAFERAWNRVIARHAALRTAFRRDDASRPSQVVHRRAACQVEWLDGRNAPASAWDDLLRDDRRRGFDLERPPLMRLTIVRTGQASWRLLWTHHHLILDGWSLPLVLREVIACYRQESEGTPAALAPAPEYSRYLRWLSRRDRAEEEAYWRDALGGFTQPNEIALPAPSDAANLPDYANVDLELTEELTARLTALAQSARVTLNTVIQALWALVVSTYSGQRDVVFGVTVSGRPADIDDVDDVDDVSDMENMVGLFINTLPLRVDAGGDEPLAALLQDVQRRQAAMSRHEASRLVDVQGWSGAPRGRSLFETILVFENYPLGESLAAAPLRDFDVQDVGSVEWTHYPLTCFVTPGRRLRLKLVYQTERFSRESMDRLLAYAQGLGESMVQGRRRPIGIVRNDFNESAENNDLGVPIHERFAAQAARTPDRVAVVCGEESLTYRDLADRSASLARYLRQQGIGRGSIAGIFMERSVEMMIALLGVLEAGGAYLPLDPRFPAERLAMMLEDASPSVVVTQSDLAPQLPQIAAQVVRIDADWPRIAATPSTASPQRRATENDLAYVIFTSGSTGRPKGVEIPHRALANVLATFARRPGMSADDTLVAVTTLSFDIAALELFLPLTVGARLVIAGIDDVADGDQLAALFERHRATVVQATPATWRLLMTTGWAPPPSMRILCGGEAMPRDLAEALLVNGSELWNVYGPTETTIWSAIGRVRAADDARSIGRPIGNTMLYVVDERLDLVPQGVSGELLIGGAGVARGYRGQPSLTAERFVPDAYSGQPGARAYRTGDRVRFGEDGRLEFLGRLDAQVKIRGFRVELGEIEAALRRDRDVRDAAAAVIGGGSLAAYLVLTSPERRPGFIAELTASLRERLPEYMVPGIYVDLDALPLTPNGKVDRKALPRPDVTAATRDSAFVAPRNALEDVLADIWKQTLAVGRVGVHDDFFALGGHSLHVAQIVAWLRQAFQIKVPLRSVFEATTVERLAAVLRTLETQRGRMDQVASALIRIRSMSPEERARRREARKARETRVSP